MQEQKVFHIAKAVVDYQRASCMEVRRKVFIEEQGYDPAVEVDDPEDALSTHFVLVVRGQLAGTVRVNDTNNKLGRFAILPEYRGKGYGIPLVQAVHEHSRARGAELVWAEVQADPRPGMDSTGFYTKAGYVPFGDKWNKLGVVHQKMVHSLR